MEYIPAATASTTNDPNGAGGNSGSLAGPPQGPRLSRNQLDPDIVSVPLSAILKVILEVSLTGPMEFAFKTVLYLTVWVSRFFLNNLGLKKLPGIIGNGAKKVVGGVYSVSKFVLGKVNEKGMNLKSKLVSKF